MLIKLKRVLILACDRITFVQYQQVKTNPPPKKKIQSRLLHICKNFGYEKYQYLYVLVKQTLLSIMEKILISSTQNLICVSLDKTTNNNELCIMFYVTTYLSSMFSKKTISLKVLTTSPITLNFFYSANACYRALTTIKVLLPNKPRSRTQLYLMIFCYRTTEASGFNFNTT